MSPAKDFSVITIASPSPSNLKLKSGAEEHPPEGWLQTWRSACEFKPSGGVITIFPELPTVDDEYTPEQRRIIDAELDKADADIRAGRVHGPFSTHKELIASLHKEAEKLRSKENKTLGVMRLLRMSLRQAVVALGPESTTPLAHTQKYDEKKNRWRAPVTRDWSFYFIIEDDSCILQDVTGHPK